ncbi:MAG: tRNA(Ile)-lysidine synthase TilS [Roseibaca calidilacus]|uniref:tRNA(Ile)-lysidine synthase n=1 Tax=Roseibaca calidilacus TaxID=1666912 RepID=A0A0P7W6X8_9RHOB|nr:tRNA lysidine(34) synthetase TilS [Roseibaca calidilacus]KPP92700.1 MAG: tRNA(Ile)-lysidine synthase TilS [Roseibaca calidilacus]CUX80227.1 tRNA(Ile)-lysidine synthase [Roseibaca calidilacus]
MSDLADRVARNLDALLPNPPKALGVAVSGGGDSLALMHLASLWAARQGCALHIASVDHGLRPEAAQECALVARHAAGLGAPHDILPWAWDGRGNLQDRARHARQDLLRNWAQTRGVSHIALGHTRDDQAETLLMRLQRGSGVDGLAGMAPARPDGPVTWLRPLLDIRREALRDHLRRMGWDWAEDASNLDPAYERVRTRQAISALGLDVDRLAETAAHMAAARQVLDHAATQAARDIIAQDQGDLVFARERLSALPSDTRERLVAAALCWVGQSPYRPRLAALRAALDRPRATLHGCLLVQRGDSLRICREWNAVADIAAPCPGPWDGRWQIDGPEPDGAEIRALGPEGAAQTDRSAWRLPRESILSSPAIWQDKRLIAAPLAGMPREFRANCRVLPPDWPASHHAH